MIYFDESNIIDRANKGMELKKISLTDEMCPLSEGTPHDYYSNGDYWWPDPTKKDGLPYLRRDGQSNPNAFFAHRKLMTEMKDGVCDLASGYRLTKNSDYAKKAEELLIHFFLKEETKMNPSLCYAQAIPGICSGRGIGLIDTIHLIDLPFGIEALRPVLQDWVYDGLRNWFSDYLNWMITHEYGVAERNEPNNHSVCWYAQAAVFAKFTENVQVLQECKEAFCERLLTEQMGTDGSFPLELGRTKPYNYSLFIVEIFSYLCQVLSDDELNLWEFSLADGRGMKKGLDFLLPFLEDKKKWCYGEDVEWFDAFPVQTSFLLFGGKAYQEERLLNLWKNLPEARASHVEEVRRNTPAKHPYLWMDDVE